MGKCRSALLYWLCLLSIALIAAGCGNRQEAEKTEAPRKSSKAAVAAKAQKPSPPAPVAQSLDAKPVAQSPQAPLGVNADDQQAIDKLLGGPSASPMAPAVPSARPTPQQLLAAVQRVYAGLASLQVEGQAVETMKQDGKVIDSRRNEKVSVAFKRPNKFVIRNAQGMFCTDGKMAYTYSAPAKAYSKSKQVREALGSVVRGNRGVGTAGLLLGVDYRSVIASSKLLKDAKVGGNDTYVLRLQFKKGAVGPPQADASQTLWIGKKDLVLYRNEAILSAKPIAPKGYKGKVPKLVENIISTRLIAFHPNARLTDAAFAFHPPTGAKLAEAPKEVSLTNKPAPDFSFEAADGTTKKLSDLRGSPVLLYVWALPMCQTHMPVIQSVYDREKDSVQFVTISFSLKKDKVNEFLKSKNLSFPVAYANPDLSKVFSQQYGLHELPATIIIDKSGIVRVAMAGFPPADTIIAQLAKVK